MTLPSSENKAQFIQNIFANIAPKYNLMNDLMTMGLHRLWKRQACELLNKNCQNILDIATGTGDLAFILSELYPNAQITGIDSSPEMLSIAHARNKSPNIQFHNINAMNMTDELENNKFNGAIISYGLRNMPNYQDCLSQIYQVLKPGGKLVILDMSYPNTLVNIISAPYRYIIIPILGKLIAGSHVSYDYLTQSHKQYLTQDALANMLSKTGFKNINYKNLLGGISCIHQAIK